MQQPQRALLIVNQAEQTPHRHHPLTGSVTAPRASLPFAKQTAADPHGVALTQRGLVALEAPLAHLEAEAFQRGTAVAIDPQQFNVAAIGPPIP